jgi:hypothetical protein
MITRLPRHIAILGAISFLTAMCSAMVYGLLPLFLLQVLHTSIASVGVIEGMAEGASSLIKIGSGVATDWLGRRKPIVVLGYLLSAVNKLLFPLADGVTTVFMGRVIDHVGKGLRDAPRDALLADVTPAAVRGSGFGLRLAFYTTGFVVGPLTAIAVMRDSHDDFRLVFWLAVIPAANRHHRAAGRIEGATAAVCNRRGRSDLSPRRYRKTSMRVLVADHDRRPVVIGALQSSVPCPQGS